MMALAETLGRFGLSLALRRAGLAAAACLFASAGLDVARAFPLPATTNVIAPAAQSASPTLPRHVRAGACEESCPDCTDCVVEIDIAPRAYPEREWEDPIARELKRSEHAPAPLGACESDRAGRRPDRRRGDPHNVEGCGIRCWYWRLRHGYCGPGCEYYRYRMHHYEGRTGHRHPRYACGS